MLSRIIRVAGVRRRLPSFVAGCERSLTAALFALTLAAGCASPGKFTWFSALPKSEWEATAGEYVIGVGDSVNIRTYGEEALSGTYKIRSDGRAALPLVGDVMMAGKHPSELAREFETRLKQFVVSPRVTVNIETSQPITIKTLGEIKQVGSLTLERPANMIGALAQAGGLTEYADDTRIFVLRQFPSFERIRFTYDAIVNNQDGAAAFPLRTGDVIVVE